MRPREFLTRHSTVITLVIIVSVCLVTLGVGTNALNVRPKVVGQSIVGALQQGFSGIGSFLARTVTSVGELRDLRKQYADLLQQVRNYEQTAGNISALRAENDRLHRLLDFSESIQISNIPARIVAKEPGSFFEGLTINRGSAAGVRRDMPVIAYQDGIQGLVGRVSEVGVTTAVVMPIHDPRSFVAARLQRSRHEGLVAGQGSRVDRLSMVYVAESARSQVATGDIVITSGMRSIFPEGIQIGTVESIRGEAYETSLQIELRPVVDFGRLEYVFVLETVG